MDNQQRQQRNKLHEQINVVGWTDIIYNLYELKWTTTEWSERPREQENKKHTHHRACLVFDLEKKLTH